MRYGIRYRTIKYWQDHAWDLWRYNAILSGVSTFDPRNLVIADARTIGHTAIGLARVMSADNLRALLTT